MDIKGQYRYITNNEREIVGNGSLYFGYARNSCPSLFLIIHKSASEWTRDSDLVLPFALHPNQKNTILGGHFDGGCSHGDSNFA